MFMIFIFKKTKYEFVFTICKSIIYGATWESSGTIIILILLWSYVAHNWETTYTTSDQPSFRML